MQTLRESTFRLIGFAVVSIILVGCGAPDTTTQNSVGATVPTTLLTPTDTLGEPVLTTATLTPCPSVFPTDTPTPTTEPGRVPVERRPAPCALLLAPTAPP